jgi:hypothetical protein
MGWGIKIPELGINTGEFVGGDVGKTLTNVSREANTPIGRTMIGGMTGLLTTPGIFDYKGAMDPGAGDGFNQLKSRWDKIANGFESEQVPQAVMAGENQSAQAVQSSLNTLGQFGGQSVGAADRLKRASKWGVAQNSADAATDGRLSGLQTKMQGITGLELPMQQGQEMAKAQADAIRAKNGGSAWGMVGTIAGGALGGAFGGPAGAGIGAGIGGGLGQNLGSRY